MDNKLAKVFDIEEQKEKQNTKTSTRTEKTSKQLYRELIDDSRDLLDGIKQVAEDTKHPRAYEVASGLLKTMSDITSKIEVGENLEKSLTPSHTTQKTVSSDDVAKMLREQSS